MANPNAVLQNVSPLEITSLRKKIGAKWYASGGLFGAGYPLAAAIATGTATAGRSIFVPMQMLEDVMFDQIGINISTLAAGATVVLGVFDCLADGTVGDPIFVSSALDASTTGIKTASCSLSFSAGRVVYIAYLVLGGAPVLSVFPSSGFVSTSGAASYAGNTGVGLSSSGQSALIKPTATSVQTGNTGAVMLRAV